MRDLLGQIKVALDINLYYCALFVSLSLPDICGAMESADGVATGDKYKKWVDDYVAHKYSGLITGEDCYFFRCSLLHQGISHHPKSCYSRVIFVEPLATTNILHCNILGDALNIDVRIFCRDILEGAEQWLERVENTEVFLKNYDKFMRRYPNGLRPYIIGVPVIS